MKLLEPDQQTETPPSLWRNRDYMGLWTGNAISALGSSISAIAYPLLMLYTTGSVLLAGVISAAGLAGSLITTLFGGLLADRMSRKVILIASPLGQGAMLAVVAYSVSAGHVSAVQLAGAELLSSMLFGLRAAAGTTAIRRIVPKEQIGQASAQSMGRDMAARLAGGPLGGVLFAISWWLPFAADAVSFVASAGGAALITKPLGPEKDGSVRARTFGDVRMGFRFVRHSRFLRFVFRWNAALNISYQSFVLLLMARIQHLGGTPATIGTVNSVALAGGVAGAIAAPVVLRRIRARLVLIATAWTFCATLVSVSLLPQIWEVCVVLFVAMSVVSPLNVVLQSYRVRLVPDAVSGRVTSVMAFGAGAFQWIGPVLAGLLADVFGITAAIWVLVVFTVPLAVVLHFTKSLAVLDRSMAEVVELPADLADRQPTDPVVIAKRRRQQRRRRILGSVLAVLLVSGAGSGTWYVQATIAASLPQTSGTLVLPGLDGPVEVDRDAKGIPQIYASTPHDLFLAQGFVQAQDRFWQMDVYRHMTAGRLSEMFGASQVKTDKLIRTMGWYRVASQEYGSLKSDTRAYLQDYSDGVNAYMAGHKGAKASVEYAILGLQVDYEPYAWSPVDSVAWLKALAWDLRSNLDEEIARAQATESLSVAQVDQLFPDYPYGQHPVIVGQGTVVNGVFDQNAGPSAPSTGVGALPQAAYSALADVSASVSALPSLMTPHNTGVGSNSWVVSGSLTKTGMPLLANDPHLSPELPQIWYQMGLHCTVVSSRCPFDVTGFTMPGMPGVFIGHNADIAWGFTNGTEDVLDLVMEKVSGQDYLYDGKEVPLTERTETIKVAGGKPVVITVRSTNQGPLISDVNKSTTEVGKVAPVMDASAPDRGTGYAVALRWTALTPGTTADAVFELDLAHNWDEFRGAAKDFAVPSQNMIYADTDGDIGYQTPGQIPIRKAGDGSWPVPGWTDRYAWTGFIPFDALPHELNPSSGFIVTANNAIIGPQYPYLLSASDFDKGYRADEIAKRLRAAIAGGAKIDSTTMSAIQGDDTNEFASVLVPYLQAAPVNSGTRKAKALLNGWDYTTPPNSAAAAFFYETWRYLLADAFHSKLPDAIDIDGGDRWFLVVTNLLPDPTSFWWTDTSSTAGPGNRDKLLGEAMNQAAADLRKREGADPSAWSWGHLHTLTPTNQTLGTSGPDFIQAFLNGDPMRLGGGSSVVDANGFDIAKSFAVDTSPSMRMIVDMADLDHSRWINLTGASGHVTSPNYLDQAALWRDNKTLPWAFSRTAVVASIRHVLVLEPVSAKANDD